MRRYGPRVGALAAGLAATLGVGGSVAGAERLLAAPAGLSVVTARIGGRGPFELLVDTGSTRSVVDAALGRELALRPVDRVVLTTPAGSRALPRADLPTLELDGKRVEGLRAIVADLPGLARTGRPLRGILGQDVLARFDLRLDFASGQLDLDAACAAAASPGAGRVPFDDPRAVVLEARGGHGGRPLRLLLDTGASGLVLFGRPAPESGLRLVATGGGWRVAAADAQRPAEAARVARLEIGGLVLEDLPAAVLEGPRQRGVDGLLPASLFSSVCVSHLDGYVVLEGAAPQAGTRMASARGGR